MKKKTNDIRCMSRIFYIAVHILEYVIATLTLIVLVGLVGLEIHKMITTDGYFASADTYLHNILTIVVGLEFVRMLINLTPANTLEVLIVAIARQVIVDHSSPLENIACVLCIGGLFAIRKFLISKKDLRRDLSECGEDSEAEPDDNPDRDEATV
ncbi:MAG: hypothetical protein IJF38_03465 [Clostridia bacterium]|nr:hypothetical protein [Clostridia bacterium]